MKNNYKLNNNNNNNTLNMKIYTKYPIHRYYNRQLSKNM